MQVHNWHYYPLQSMESYNCWRTKTQWTQEGNTLLT